MLINLKHLPSLEIREGAIDRLVNLYKQMISKSDVSIKQKKRQFIRIAYIFFISTKINKLQFFLKY